MVSGRSRLFLLAVVAVATVGLCSTATASASVEAYVGCSHDASAQPAHSCHKGASLGAFFRSSTDTEYDICLVMPAPAKSVCAENQVAAANTLYLNPITLSALGDYSVVWKASEDGTELASWHFKLVAATALTPAAASAAFRALISRRSPRAVFPGKEGKVCPKVYKGSEGKISFCFAEYRIGRTWHLEGASASLEAGEIRFRRGSHGRWRRKWRRCRLPRRVPGKLFANNGCGKGTIENDAYFVEAELLGNIRSGHPLRPIGWQFTFSAGFGSIGIYHGRRKGSGYVFTNGVGDSFRYVP